MFICLLKTWKSFELPHHGGEDMQWSSFVFQISLLHFYFKIALQWSCLFICLFDIYTENTIWTLGEDCWSAGIYRTKEGWTGSCLNRMDKVHFVVVSHVRQCCVHMLVENLEVFRVTSSWRRRHAMVVFCFSDFTIALLFQDRVAVIMSFYLSFRYIYRKQYMDSRRGLLICRNLSHKIRLNWELSK